MTSLFQSMTQGRWAARAALVIVSVALVTAVPRAAAAQDKKAIKRIEDANAKAMEEYDLLEFESAKKLLNSALVDVKRNGLDKHPVAAKTHGNLGIVYEGLGDPDNALLEFIAALEIDGNWTVPKEYKKPELKKVYDTARSTVGGGGGEPVGGGGGDEDVVGLVHAPVEEGKEGASIGVAIKVGADVAARQVILYYRAQGQESFVATPMRNKSGATWEASIPASATRADSIQYYIEAKGGGGKVNASVGSPGSPNIIEVARTTSGGGGGGGDIDDENPLGGGGGSGGDGDGIRKPAVGKARHTVFVNVNVGTGVGFVTGDTEQSAQAVTCCVASAPFHVQPELGFWLSPRLALSVYGRIGLPIGANIPGHAPAAPAGLLRVLYMLGKNGEGVSLHGDIGGGFIRHVITLDEPHMTPDGPGDIDTVATGPLLVGGGVNWSQTLGGPVRLVVDFNLLAGVPIVEVGGVKPFFALNLDLNLGLQLAF